MKDKKPTHGEFAHAVRRKFAKQARFLSRKRVKAYIKSDSARAMIAERYARYRKNFRAGDISRRDFLGGCAYETARDIYEMFDYLLMHDSTPRPSWSHKRPERAEFVCAVHRILRARMPESLISRGELNIILYDMSVQELIEAWFAEYKRAFDAGLISRTLFLGQCAEFTADRIFDSLSRESAR